MLHPQDEIQDEVLEGDESSCRSKDLVRVQMLGGSGVGKTCFLAGLALLNEQSDGHTFVLPVGSRTTAIFDQLRETLEGGQWPCKTSIVDKLTFSIQNGCHRVDVALADFAGEGFSDAMKRGDESEAAKQVKTLVGNADVLLILLDGAAVDRNQDFAGSPLIKAVFERMESNDLEERGNKELEAAVILTKKDLCIDQAVTTAEDLQSLVENREPDLSRYLRERNIRTQWIPISVCGSGATDSLGTPIYEKLAPEGYDAIFSMLFRRRLRPLKRRFGIVLSCVALLILMGLSWIYHTAVQLDAETALIMNPQTALADLPERVFEDNRIALRERLRQEIQAAKLEMDNAGGVSTVEYALKPMQNLPDAQRSLVESELIALESHAKERIEQLLYQQVVDCLTLQHGNCEPSIAEYLREFPQGAHADELREELESIQWGKYLTARGNVKSISVQSPSGLRARADAISNFLQDHGSLVSVEEKDAMTQARDLAVQFLTELQYNCTLVRTSGMDTPRDHGVEISLDSQRILTCNNSGDVTEKSWNRDFTLSWSAGQNLEVDLVNFDLRNQDMAYFGSDSPFAIVILARENAPRRYATTEKWGGTDFTQSRPPFLVEFKCRELPQAKLDVISDYLYPGEKW